jgi:hydroxymethylglutaryl-CoA reductase
MPDNSEFRKLGRAERLEEIRKRCGLEKSDIEPLNSGLDERTAEMMSENVIGTIKLPFGIATNFIINGKEYLVPMCIEEPSVVAAASHAAKLSLPGGFRSECDEPLMIGQIQIMNPKTGAGNLVLSKKDEIKRIANSRDSVMVKLGGGLRGVEVRDISSPRGEMLVVHLIVNVMDAMGANCVNGMCESVAPYLEELTGGRSVLKIISNLADKRLVRAEAVWKKSVIGENAVEGVLDAYELARADPYRCATNNKGIMNGVDAVAIATGNDFRALEAGAHAFAAQGGYRPLAKYAKNAAGDLVGRIEMPVAVGVVGGATKTNPVAKTALKILGIKSASELAMVMACVGLANNFAAMRAIAVEGIQKGHLRLHAKNFAAMAGAEGSMVDKIAKKMVEEKNISYSRALEILKEMKRKG